MGTAGRLDRDVTKELAGLLREGVLGARSDAELLARFVEARDERALEALIQRHGRLVYSIAWSILRRPNEIDDVFQATFLALVRKAPELKVRQSLAPWLQRVARRFAWRELRLARRAERLETQLLADDAMPCDDLDARETLSLVHAEIARLPDRYRDVVLLVDLEGLSQGAAAARLQCPVGTVSGRLTRARRILKERLTRKGVVHASPGAALLAHSPSAELTSRTLSVATAAAARFSIISQGFWKGAILLMLSSKWRFTVVTLLALVLTASSGHWFPAKGRQAGGLGLKPDPAKIPKRIVDLEKRLPELHDENGLPIKLTISVAKPRMVYNIEVLECLPGRPITGEYVVHDDGAINLGWYGEVQVAGMTRREIKEAVVLHLRKYMSEDALGLESKNDAGQIRAIAPVDTNKVYVEESMYAGQGDRLSRDAQSQLSSISSELSRIRAALERIESKLGGKTSAETK